MAATKTKKSSVMKMTALPVKIGRLRVYLEESEGTLQKGPTGRAYDPAVFIFTICETKAQRRKVRQALDRLGLRGLAKATVAPQQLSFAELDRLDPKHYHKITNRRDSENFNESIDPRRKYRIPTPTSKMAEVERRHTSCEFCPAAGGPCFVCAEYDLSDLKAG